MDTEIVDVERAYQALARRLERVVALDVRAPAPVIEDACQVAWARLIDHAGAVSGESALPWLARTAAREACRMLRREQRELSLESDLEGGDWIVGSGPLPYTRAEQRERLSLLDALPVRQQRLMWLHAVGLSYGEIARVAGCTPRTVERQLLRAKRKIRAAASEYDG